MKNYETELERTKPKAGNHPLKGSNEEEKAIALFTWFYKDFSRQRIEKNLEELYAEDAWFSDAIQDVKGTQEIRRYFLSSVQPVHTCRFQIDHVSSEGGEYYFRWVMKLKLKRKKNELIEIPGMSHVRFDGEGRVTFHQDYWDTNLLFERFPVIGSVIRRLKGKIGE